MNKAVVFTKGKPTENANSFDTSISALIANGVEVTGADKLKLGQVYTLTSVADATALGIDDKYDEDNKVVLFHHIDEFYRMSLPGTKLYLMVVAQTVKPNEIFDEAHPQYARKLVADAKGEVRQLAVAFNPTATYVATELTTSGFNNDINTAIQPAHEFAMWTYETERPLHVLLEGRAFSATGTSALNLRELEISAGFPLEADKVSIVIGQDYGYASRTKTDSINKKYAAVGTALGTLSGINVNQNIGEVETLNLSNGLKGKFLKAGLSSHQTIEASESLLEDLDKKGYIFPVSYTGISGYRWNNDHVCSPEIVDDEDRMNESTIAYGRTMDDATRRLRKQLVPKIRSVQPVDASGLLPVGVVKSFDSLGDEIFQDMQAEGLISSGKTYTDATSDLLTGDKALKVAFDLQPTGSINKIQGTINLKKSL